MSGGGAGLMSCVREGSLEPPYRPPQPHTDTHNHGEGRTGRFLRGLRRMFKRRGSGVRADASPDPKSSSTGELLHAERHARRQEGVYGSGLSVSHDSVFTGERSGDESSDDRATPAHSLAHVASHRAELVAAVRRRGRGDSDEEEDQGFPLSPPGSPLTDKDKRHHAGISQSSCSDGSLLSVGSSEMDEDSGHLEHSRSEIHDTYKYTLEPPTGVAPLSHSAAKHKMAVRPRRTHGAPRRNKTHSIAASALPITPELNEEMIRSTTPDVTHTISEVVTESLSSSTTKHVIVEQHVAVTRELQRVLETPTDVRLKSSSLPPGLALSQLGHSPARLTLADTPRSSIKRSQSNSQGPNPRDSPKMPSYHSEDRMTKYHKHEESCHKTKTEKRTENEGRKKEESFFSRLLLRKSGKKTRKEDDEGKKKEKQQFKPVDNDTFQGQGYKPIPAERTHKSAGQKAFANQMHKRFDNKGGYAQDGAYKDVYSAAKVPGVEYNITDLKLADETDKMLNYDMKRSRRDEYVEKRKTSKETLDEKREFNLPNITEKVKRPTSIQRDFTKAFISNEVSRVQEEVLSPSLVISDEEPPIRAMRIKTAPNDFMFSSGSMPKNIPYFNPSFSSPKNSDIKHKSEELISEFSEKIERKREIHHATKTEESYVTSGLRSLGDEYVESRSSIGKSHSFRYASECTSICSQDQLPSLPAIVGISEPILENWEINYRKNLNDKHDLSKRISARNYNILHGTAEANYDSLPSTDSSYLDSLKNDINDDRKLFTSSIHVSMDSKRNSDISQIEAKIDDIISSPKPIIAPILKSSSLDSVKSSPEKQDDRRKTIAVETGPSAKNKDVENFISVTHINKEQSSTKTIDAVKVKSDEKLAKPGLPEFLNIQLNKVDVKPVTNIVLTANVTPKKTEIQPEKEPERENTQELTQSQVKKENAINKINETVTDNEDKSYTRQSVIPVIPQSPSTPKTFFKRKAASVDLPDKTEKPRANSVSTDGSSEKIYDNISMDQKSHSSFGSKSSIQSSDSNDIRIPDRHEEAVVLRRKHIKGEKKDDEPELMKVFARRSLKIKDTEADSIAQDIAAKEEKTKTLKNEFNASIKSRDSDKENEEIKDDKRSVDIAARVSQFGQYQRSVSIQSVNPKRESAPSYRSEVIKYKKEVSDSTPEKRLRNRTFPDSSNDREDIKNITKEAYKADTLKRPWMRDENRLSIEDKAVIGESEKEGEREREDEAPQFKGILQMRAEWERRAKQGMTK